MSLSKRVIMFRPLCTINSTLSSIPSILLSPHAPTFLAHSAPPLYTGSSPHSSARIQGLARYLWSGRRSGQRRWVGAQSLCAGADRRKLFPWCVGRVFGRVVACVVGKGSEAGTIGEGLGVVSATGLQPLWLGLSLEMIGPF